MNRYYPIVPKRLGLYLLLTIFYFTFSYNIIYDGGRYFSVNFILSTPGRVISIGR